MTVTLPPELESFVEEQVKSGNYASREEWLNTAAQAQKTYDEKLAWLKAAIQEGLDSINREEEFSMDELMEEIEQELSLEQSR
jgi:putative addiction module CopG family antidote